jgi:thiosulfate/3-mercaptopyruvate sulfurtransferase
MTTFPLINARELYEHMAHQRAGVLVLDCSFELTDPGAGRRAYAAGHLPGAVYVHLEDTLSAPKNGRNGRHPLPTRAAFARTMAELGANDDTLIVGYDNAGGMYAARLWWMLRWAGHARAAVLDGGVGAWKAEGLPIDSTSVPARAEGHFSLREPLVSTIDYEGVKANLATGERLVIDARAPDRFRGENETLDPIGGHIPGARNRLFRDNLGADGRFKPAAVLRGELTALFGGRAPESIVNQCGSGVTACHNVLAQAVAGLEGAALYPGSWSEWCAQPGAPVATGSEA